MINIFRKIRKSLLFSKKTSSYFIYAIGEIVLVMIGILLALYVNNWNEERKQQGQLNAVLETIKTDLEADTLAASIIIKYYKEVETNSKKILTGEITTDNYTECIPCLNLVTIYQPFNIQTKGYKQLTNFTGDIKVAKDSLISGITKSYSVFTPLIDKNNNMMEDVVFKNFNDFENYPWFIDMSMGKMTPEIIKYFIESKDYKKRVASHGMLAVRNHLGVTQQYKSNATILIEQINKRLLND